MTGLSRRINRVLASFFLLGAITPSQATLLFYEGFASEDYTEGALAGQPLVGEGYAPGSWTTTSTFNPGGLEHPVLATTPGFSLSKTAGEPIANLNTTPGGPFGLAGFVGSDGAIGGEGITEPLYFSLLARRDDTIAEAGFAGFQVFQGASEGFGPGEVGNPTFHTWFRNGSNGVIGEGTSLTPPGQTHLYVFRLDFAEGTTTNAQIWINPDITLPEADQLPATSTNVTNAVTTPSGGFDNLRFRGTRIYSYDELRIGTTWEDVTPRLISTSLAITDFVYSPTTNEITITWSSRESETYRVNVSADLVDWATSLETPVISPDPGDSTTKTFDLSQSLVGPLSGSEALFFRIEVAQ